MLARNATGIGLRAPHYQQVLEERPPIDFLEVHSENFFHAGGAALRLLERAREHYPLSLHGVGLGLASADPLAAAHVDALAALVTRFQPALVSEHLSWGATEGEHFNDLLPFPYTAEALTLVSGRVSHLQDRLGRQVLIENLSAYLQFRASEMSECEFLAELVARSGCGLLLDVNNLYVNACNFDFDPLRELARLPASAIGEIHLAGHTVTDCGLIDTHSAPVCDGVWALYRAAIRLLGAAPTLIEWDAELPALEVLLAERDKAAACLESRHD